VTDVKKTMTRAPAAYRYILRVVASIVIVAACRHSGDGVPIQVVDLAREFDRAEKRPSAGFKVTTYGADGVIRPSIVMPVPSRVTWAFPLPRRGQFRASVALADRANSAAAIRFRFGVSDHRIYEALAEHTVTAAHPGWFSFSVDLSAYAGFKWSLFYRPDDVTWRVVLGADIAGEGAAAAVWGSPEIVTDARGAKEYVQRRHQRR
jgi:hypothetical protein